jgi:hypothetical protein
VKNKIIVWFFLPAAAERTKNMDSYIRSNRSSISSSIDVQAFAFRISG